MEKKYKLLKDIIQHPEKKKYFRRDRRYKNTKDKREKF
jgi:hypothetical protein